MGADHIKERSTNEKTHDYVTRARPTPEGVGVDMSTCPPPEPVSTPEQPDDELAARRREALNRLARQQPAYRPRETR
ncbi:hypothetical protein GA0070563_13122 [Micromonospora carbonacea]|uniref:Uncharacterized protein n=1 Tax=Micromonospora carbonacea TaxID=47853 RepID=A0A1C5AZ03_9ACTN|nr:hypothetical protein GA0070563_13122 [Micromonospora carbonacea]